MHTPASPARALAIVAGSFIGIAALPAVLLALTNAPMRNAWAAFGAARFILGLGLWARFTLAHVLAKGWLAVEIVVGMMIVGGAVFAPGGRIYWGYNGAWLYTEVSRAALLTLVIVLVVDYWQWRTLGRIDVAELFRKHPWK